MGGRLSKSSRRKMLFVAGRRWLEESKKLRAGSSTQRIEGSKDQGMGQNQSSLPLDPLIFCVESFGLFPPSHLHSQHHAFQVVCLRHGEQDRTIARLGAFLDHLHGPASIAR